MKNQFLTHSFTVDKTPLEVFDAINNVRGWWSGQIKGKTEKLGDEFTYQYETFHRSTQKITESVPGKKVVWTISDSYLSFVEDKTEWKGTKVIFDISERWQNRGLLYPPRSKLQARMLRCLQRCLGFLYRG